MEDRISGRQAGAWGFCAMSVPAVLTCAGLGWGWVLLGCAAVSCYLYISGTLSNGAVDLLALTQEAFDIADRYRNPVMVLGDGLIGQMMEPVDMDEASNRKPASDLKPKTWAATGHVPTADSPRAVINSLYIDPQAMETHCQHLQAKYDAIEAAECRWQEEMVEDADIVLVAYGTTSRIARSAMP